MAKVFLNQNETYSVMGNSDVFGGTGYETLKIDGSPIVTVQSTVERIEFTGNLNTYTFGITGNVVTVKSGAATVATIAVPDTAAGQQLAFADGAAAMKITGLNVATLGGVAIPTTVGPVAAVLDITQTSAYEGRTFTLKEIETTKAGDAAIPDHDVVYWGYNPHENGNSGTYGDATGGPEDGGVPVADLADFLVKITGLDFAHLGLIDDDGVGGHPFDNVTNLEIGDVTNGDNSEVKITYTDGTTLTTEAVLGDQYLTFLNNLLFDENGNSRLYMKTVEGTDKTSATTTHNIPIVLTTTQNNGGTFEGGFTAAGNDTIVSGQTQLLHQAYLDGGKGYDILEIDAKGVYAQPLQLLNIEEIRVQNLPNVYSDGIQAGDSTYPNLNETSAVAENSIIDLSRATSIQKLIINEGGWYPSDVLGTSVDMGSLTVVGVRNNADLRLEGGFTNDVNVHYGQGLTGVLNLELALGTIDYGVAINILQNASALNIDSQGLENYMDQFFAGGGITRMNITGTGALAVEDDMSSSFNEDRPIIIDASKNTGGIDFTMTDIYDDVTITGTSARDELTVETDDSHNGNNFDHFADITISVGEGNNFVDAVADAGNVVVTSGAGNDVISAEATDWGNVTINAGAGDNYVDAYASEGGSYTDYAAGDATGNVNVTTGAGNDNILAEAWEGDISITAGNGKNWVESETQAYAEDAGAIVITTGTGDDSIWATAEEYGAVTITAGDGKNYIEAKAQYNDLKITTGAGNDTVYAWGNGPEWSCDQVVTINTGDGDDNIAAYGYDGNVLVDINSGAGVDQIEIDAKKSIINSGAGNDIIDIKGRSVVLQEVFVTKFNINTGEGQDRININGPSYVKAAPNSSITGSSAAGSSLTLAVKHSSDISLATLSNVTAVQLWDLDHPTPTVLTLNAQQFTALGPAAFTVANASLGLDAVLNIKVTADFTLGDLSSLGKNIRLTFDIFNGAKLTLTAEQLHDYVLEGGIDSTDGLKGKVVITSAGLDFNAFDHGDHYQVTPGGTLSDTFLTSDDVTILRSVGGFSRPEPDDSTDTTVIDSTGTATLVIASPIVVDGGEPTTLKIIGNQDVVFQSYVDLGDGADRGNAIDFSELDGTVTGLTVKHFDNIASVAGNNTGTRINVEMTGDIGSDEQGLVSSGVSKYVVTAINEDASADATAAAEAAAAAAAAYTAAIAAAAAAAAAHVAADAAAADATAAAALTDATPLLGVYSTAAATALGAAAAAGATDAEALLIASDTAYGAWNAAFAADALAISTAAAAAAADPSNTVLAGIAATAAAAAALTDASALLVVYNNADAAWVTAAALDATAASTAAAAEEALADYNAAVSADNLALSTASAAAAAASEDIAAAAYVPVAGSAAAATALAAAQAALTADPAPFTFYLCDETQDVTVLGLQGNADKTVIFEKVPWGLVAPSILLEGDGYADWNDGLKADGNPNASDIGNVVVNYFTAGAPAVVNINNGGTPLGVTSTGGERGFAVGSIALTNAASVKVNVTEGDAVIHNISGDSGLKTLTLAATEDVTVTHALPATLTKIDAGDVTGKFTTILAAAASSGAEVKFAFIGSDGGVKLTIDGTTGASFDAVTGTTIDGGAMDADLTIKGTVTLDKATLTNIDDVVLAQGASLKLTVAQATEIGAAKFALATGATAASLNLSGLDGEPFAIADYAEGIGVAVLSLADLPVVKLHPDTDLTDIGSLYVPEGTVLELTAAQFQQLNGDGTITGEGSVHITDLYQIDVGAHGADLDLDYVDLSGEHSTLTITLAESVDLSNSDIYSDYNDLARVNVFNVGDDMTLTLGDITDADGVEINGGANSVLKFTDTYAGGFASIDASGFDVATLKVLNVLVANRNVDLMFDQLPAGVVKEIYNDLGWVDMIDQHVTIEAGTTVPGNLIFNPNTDDTELKSFTLTMAGGTEITGNLRLSTTEKIIDGVDQIHTHLDTLTINSNVTLDDPATTGVIEGANLITGKTANIITGDISPLPVLGGGYIEENNLLNVVINAAQDLIVKGDIIFNSVTGDDSITANDNDDATAVMTVTGAGDVTIGGIDITDADITHAQLIHTGAGALTITLDGNNLNTDLALAGSVTITGSATGTDTFIIVDYVDLSAASLSNIDALKLEDGSDLTLSQAQYDQITASGIITVLDPDNDTGNLHLINFGSTLFDATALDEHINLGAITIVDSPAAPVILDLGTDLTGADRIVVPEGTTLSLTAEQFQQLDDAGTIVGIDANGDVSYDFTVNITGLTQADVDLLNSDGDRVGLDFSGIDAANITLSLVGDVALAADTVLPDATGTGIPTAIAGFDFSVVLAAGQTLGLATSTQADGLVVDGTPTSTLVFLFDHMDNGDTQIDAAGYDVGFLKAVAHFVGGTNVEDLLLNVASSVNEHYYEDLGDLIFTTETNRVVVIDPAVYTVGGIATTYGINVPGSLIYNDLQTDKEVRSLDLTMTGGSQIDHETTSHAVALNLSTVAKSPDLEMRFFDTLKITSEGAYKNYTSEKTDNIIDGDITGGTETLQKFTLTVTSAAVSAGGTFTLDGHQVTLGADADANAIAAAILAATTYAADWTATVSGNIVTFTATSLTDYIAPVISFTGLADPAGYSTKQIAYMENNLLDVQIDATQNLVITGDIDFTSVDAITYPDAHLTVSGTKNVTIEQLDVTDSEVDTLHIANTSAGTLTVTGGSPAFNGIGGKVEELILSGTGKMIFGSNAKVTTETGVEAETLSVLNAGGLSGDLNLGEVHDIDSSDFVFTAGTGVTTLKLSDALNLGGHHGAASWTFDLSDTKAGSQLELDNAAMFNNYTTVDVNVDNAAVASAATAGVDAYNFAVGTLDHPTYAHTINGFEDGDRLLFPSGGTLAITNGTAGDGDATLVWTKGVKVITVNLTGLDDSDDTLALLPTTAVDATAKAALVAAFGADTLYAPTSNLTIDLGADATLLISEDTDLTDVNLTFTGTQSIVLADGVDLTLTAAQANGLKIIAGPDKDGEPTTNGTVTIRDLGDAAVDFSNIAANISGTVTLVDNDVTCAPTTNLGSFSVTLNDVGGDNTFITGQTIRFNTVPQAEREIIVNDTTPTTSSSTNVIWLFPSIASANGVETKDYDPLLGRLWFSKDLLANEALAHGGVANVENLFTTLPHSILRNDFATVTALDILLESNPVERVVEFTNFKAVGDLTFSDTGAAPEEHIQSLELRLGGEVTIGNILIDDVVAATDTDAATVSFDGLTITSARALRGGDASPANNHVLATLLPEPYINDNDGTPETGEHVLPADLNTVGNIGIGSNNGVNLLSVTLNTLALSVEDNKSIGSGAKLDVGTITYSYVPTVDDPTATALLDVTGANDINITSVNATDPDITKLTVDATSFTGVLTAPGHSPALQLGTAETLTITNIQSTDGTIILGSATNAGVSGAELSWLDASLFDGKLDLGTLAVIDGTDDPAIVGPPAHILHDAFTLTTGTGETDLVVTANTLAAGSTWNFAMNDDRTSLGTDDSLSTLTFTDLSLFTGGGTVDVTVNNHANVTVTVSDVDINTQAEVLMLAAYGGGFVDVIDLTTAGAVTLNAATAIAVGAKLGENGTVTVYDTAAAIQVMTAAQLSAAAIDVIDVFDNAITLNVAQELAADAKLLAADTITVSDTGAAITAMTVAQIGSAKIDVIDANDNAITLNVAQEAAADAKLVVADVITVADTSANLIASLAALVASTKVDAIDSTADAITLTVAQEISADAKLVLGDVITVFDTGAAIAAMTVAQISSGKIDTIDASNFAISLNVAQELAANAKLVLDDIITVADTGANIALMTAGQIGSAKVDFIDASDNAITLTVAQVTQADPDPSATISVSKLADGDTITVADAGGAIGTMAVDHIGSAMIDVINATNDAITLNVAQELAADAKLVAGDTITVVDTGANIQAMTAAQLSSAKIDTIDASGTGPFTLNVGQWLAADAKLVVGDVITVSDVAANITPNLAALLASSKVDVIDVTDAKKPTVAQFLSVDPTEVLSETNLLSSDFVIITDGGGNIDGMTAAQLTSAKIDFIDATDNAISLTVAQEIAANPKLVAADTITVSDTGANIATMTTAQLSSAKIDVIDAGDDAISLTVAQELAADAKLVGGDVITVTDSAALVVASLAAMTSDKIDSIDFTDAGVSLTVAQETALDAKLVAGDTITVADSAANVIASIALMASGKIDSIDFTDAAVSLNVAQETALDAKLVLADTITVTDSAANVIAAGGMTSDKIDSIDFTDAAVSLTVAQETALDAKLVALDVITVTDSAANVTAALAVMTSASIDTIDFNDAAVSLTVAQEIALDAKLVLADVITVADSAANVTASIALMTSGKIDSIDFSDGAVSLTVAQEIALDTKLVAGDIITVTDSAANVKASLAAMSSDNIDSIDFNDAAVSLSVLQEMSLDSKLVAADVITVTDSAAFVKAAIASMASGNIDSIDFNDAAVSLSVLQEMSLDSKLVTADVITVTDSAALIVAAIASMASGKIDSIDFNDAAVSLSFANEALIASKLVAADVITVTGNSATLGGQTLAAATMVDFLSVTGAGAFFGVGVDSADPNAGGGVDGNGDWAYNNLTDVLTYWDGAVISVTLTGVAAVHTVGGDNIFHF